MNPENRISECAAYISEISKLGKTKPGTAAYQRQKELEILFTKCFGTVEGCFCGGRKKLLEEALSEARSGDIQNAKNIAVAAFKTFNLDAKKVFSKLF